MPWILLETAWAWIQWWAERMRIWWLRGVLGGSLPPGYFLSHFSPVMKCNHYNKFLSLSFDSISASLENPLESIHCWVKHCSHDFAAFDAFMVTKWLGVWERWEEVCACRSRHVLQLSIFSVLFPFSQMSGWSETWLRLYDAGLSGGKVCVTTQIPYRYEWIKKNKFSAILERLPNLY